MSPKVGSDSDCPVIDVGKLGGDPSTEDWRRVGQELMAAFIDFGYAYVVNHGVPDDALKKMFEASAEFFRLPEDQKNSFATDGFHGYMAVGQQRLGENYEIREIFDIRRESDPLPDALVPDLRSGSAHLKPSLTSLSVRILKALEYGLELQENILLNAHSESLLTSDLSTIMRITHYPPVPADCPPNAVRLAPHTDYGSITLDLQDEHGGLELRNRQGEWVRAECSQEGAVIVLLGDAMEQWTKGKLQATEHQVTAPKNDHQRRLPRRSIIFACQPNGEAKLAPFDGTPSKMSHMTYKDYSIAKQMKTLNY